MVFEARVVLGFLGGSKFRSEGGQFRPDGEKVEVPGKKKKDVCVCVCVWLDCLEVRNQNWLRMQKTYAAAAESSS